MNDMGSREIAFIRKDFLPNSKKIPEYPFILRINFPDNTCLNFEMELEEAKYIASELTQNIKDIIKRISTFKINKYLTLKLVDSKTIIYVAGERFNQCKSLFLNIPKENVSDYDEIKSIDDISENLSKGILNSHFSIAPEMEFQGHCSNLQVWYENDYDTRLLHKNLAFPLLKKLADVGDQLAKRKFKEEIAERIESGEPNVLLFLIYGKYLDYFSEEELDIICNNLKDSISIWLLKGYKEDNREFLRKYDKDARGFFFKDGRILLCNAKNCDKQLIHEYHPEVSVHGKIKCKYTINKTFLDFGVRAGNKKAVYSLENIQFGIALLKNKEDIVIAIPKDIKPLRLYSPSQNLFVFIKQSEIII